MSSPLRAAASALVVCLALACAPRSDAAPRDPGAVDTAFASMQQRGKMAMGVDQATSTHRFDALPDGGRIELLRNVDDTVGIAQIRAHLRLIEHAFQAGDFSTPQFVHMQAMPGTAEMARKRDVIVYSYHELPRGGEVVMTTTDAQALAAIHAFMGAQRSGHHASGVGAAPPP
ncbi:MAG TPA: hypothetical protein VK617_01010 [Gemmatimonadaceae bacterium]|nr:hypothetical protein [Gemmatimonadaceae bacterium]